MPTRPVENPQRPGYSGDLGAVSNLGDYPAFEGMNEWGSGDWPGTAAMNPWDVPEAIDFEWQFSPEWADEWPGSQGTAPGQADLPAMSYDADFHSRYGAPDPMGFDPTPEAARAAGFELQFNPDIAANRGWGLDYSLMAPEGAEEYGQGRLPWRLSSEQEFAGWPWARGYTGEDFRRQEEETVNGNGNGYGNGIGMSTDLPWDPTVNTRNEEFDLETDEDDPAGGIPTHLADLWMALTGQIPGKGDVARTMSEVPLVPEGWEDETRVEVGQDPLSQGITSSLAQLTGQSGGVADTPLARQSEQALRQIIFQGGRGAENLSDTGYATQAALQEIIDAQGARAAETTTPLGDETQQTLRELMASGGQLPADAQRRALEMETLRNPIEAFRQAQLSQGQAAMADRGLLGQGPELDYMSRLEETLAPMYAGAGQQLALGEAERADQRYREAVQQSNLMSMEQARLREGRLATALTESSQLAQHQSQLREDRLSSALTRSTGWNEEAARNLVNAARAGTEYQDMLGNLALENIRENRLWNDMLFQAGIDRAEALDAIQRGNLDALLPVIQEYLQAASRIGDAYVVGSE